MPPGAYDRKAGLRAFHGMVERSRMLTYEQGVAPFRDTKRLSDNDKAALMGGTLQKVYNW
jgi:hypothetical protein